MCMKMGPDAGRDFLSTKDPVRKEPMHSEADDAKCAIDVERPLRLADILEQYFTGRNKR